ncbi:uncharacterized protein LOC117345315 [Pecten maximus]|uniref:uncharacterized protein LOC117345315 n=1 Tax=Pecten maximus TaxID=6579 RepID=UPI001458A820|nr:uncharacterized protein LOC117345315 [Pecten maximus]
MPTSCCVIDCTSRGDARTKLSFYRFPKKPERKRLWLAALKRKDWTPNDSHRVCGRHFINGKSNDPLDPDYVPSVSMGYEPLRQVTPGSKRHVRLRKREEEIASKENTSLAANILLELSASEPKNQCDPVADLDPHAHCINTITRLQRQNSQMQQELQRLQAENEDLRASVDKVSFGPNLLKDNNSRTTSYTGLPSYACFLWLLNYVVSVLPKKQCLDSASVLMIILMKLRMNALNFDLAVRFRCSESVISDVVNNTIPVLASKLAFLIHWPEKDDIIRTMPDIVRQHFKGCRCIIDCTEIFIDRPGNLTARASTWSNYKHNNTLKLLVAITPCGAISYLSRVFGGRTSDKIITQRSGFLDLISYNDVVLADRGFLISEELVSRGATLVIPAFTRGLVQLSQKDIERTRTIARVRIHVERAIGRLKTFKVISGPMPMSLVPHVDSVVTICAALCNLQPSLVT